MKNDVVQLNEPKTYDDFKKEEIISLIDQAIDEYNKGKTIPSDVVEARLKYKYKIYNR